MGYTVTRAGGMTQDEYLDYVRLSQRIKVDLGRAPRILDPEMGRWLIFWEDRQPAQALLNELREDTEIPDEAWQVVEVDGPVSEGPLGPIIIEVKRASYELTFGLDPLSNTLIQSAFPDAVSTITYALVETTTWENFRRKRGDLGALVREIAPALTGLTHEQLEAVGYSFLDVESRQATVVDPIAVLAHV